ncbi:hypothetical protein [Pedobacter sp.]
MAKAVYSLESLKMGAAGANGVMGTTLADIFKIAAGSVTFDWPEPTTTDITAEEDSSAWVSLEEKQPKKISFESQDMSLEAVKVAFGGSITTTKLTPGINFTIPPQSLEIITRALQGSKAKWSFPLVQVIASLTGTLQKSDLLRIKFSVTILQPTNASGVALPDFTYELVAA